MFYLGALLPLLPGAASLGESWLCCCLLDTSRRPAACLRTFVAAGRAWHDIHMSLLLLLSNSIGTGSSYSENHTFAVFFTVVAALSQGLGGFIAVLGLSDYGNGVAHLMSFSTGVMIYLSFMDIMFDTSKNEEVGEFYASLAFFVGMGIFLLLEVCLPEVEGTQFAEVLGFGWTPSPSSKAAAAQDPKPEAADMKSCPPTSPSKSKVRQRTPAPRALDLSLVEKEARTPTARSKRSPRAERPEVLRQQSPPPSQKRKTFENEGEATLTDKRKKSIAFSGMMAMVSISLHNIPEGIAVYLTCLKGVKSGLPLAIAMSLHNIPEGMAVAGPLYAASKSKSKAVLAATVRVPTLFLFRLLLLLLLLSFSLARSTPSSLSAPPPQPRRSALPYPHLPTDFRRIRDCRVHSGADLL